jgi:MarR family
VQLQHDMRRSLSSAQRHDVAVVDALFEFAPAFNALMEAGLAARGLSLSRATLLWELAARGPAIQRELADALGVVPRTVTGMVDELAARKLVERVPHPQRPPRLHGHPHRARPSTDRSAAGRT